MKQTYTAMIELNELMSKIANLIDDEKIIKEELLAKLNNDATNKKSEDLKPLYL